jgi:recombination protein RecA
MSFAQQTRRSVEAALAERSPGALSPRLPRAEERLCCGIEGLDALLQGGVPCIGITELVGSVCSGRTTAALAYVAAVTRTGSVCAWIDGSDCLDVSSAVAQGVDLDRLLWVRCGGVPRGEVEGAASEMERTEGGLASGPGLAGSGIGSEGSDMPTAIRAMLQSHGGLYDEQARRERRQIGTPGAVNRKLSEGFSRSEDREEQVNSDRMPARRGANLSLASRERLSLAPVRVRETGARVTWQAIDQALRATDLVLQAGGFSTLVLDLGNVAPEMAWRIPAATWFRFRAACERTRVSLLLLTRHACARSSAELVVRLEGGELLARNRVMTGVRYGGEAERSRLEGARKPAHGDRGAHWVSEALWA